jgi:hypothetical protein
MMLDLRNALYFGEHPALELDDLLRLGDPCVVFEGEQVDSDGVVSYVYTVGGFLDGKPVGEADHATKSVKGCTIGGDCIMVQASSREEADAMAADGLDFTITEHRRQLLKDTVDQRMNSGILIDAAGRKVH